MYFGETIEIESFIGKIFVDIKISETKDFIIFIENNGTKYKMYHDEDCCENVYLEDWNGEIEDLLNSPIVIAEEITNKNIPPKEGYSDRDESYTWTFYKLATEKGYVTLRWFGESNGYYSESIDIIEIKGDN